MPYIGIQASIDPAPESRDTALREVSRVVVEITGKAESHMMLAWTQACLHLGGDASPCLFVDVRGIGGLDPDTNNRLTAAISDVLATTVKIPSDRVYVTFTELAPTHWGWQGKTFAS